MESNGTCSEHQGLAISCSQITAIHETLKGVDRKIDSLDTKLDDAIKRAFELDTRLSILETQKHERWRVQGWWNKTLAGSVIAIATVLFIEWTKFHGGI